MTDEPLHVDAKKGRVLPSWGLVIACLTAGGLVLTQFLTMKFGQQQLLDKLTSSDEAIKSNEEAVEKNSEALADLTEVMAGLRVDVNAALNDRWTATDEKFYGLETVRFWSDFQRLNPGIPVPTWPEPKRVTDNDGEK